MISLLIVIFISFISDFNLGYRDVYYIEKLFVDLKGLYTEYVFVYQSILVPRGRDPFGRHQKSRHLAGPDFLNTRRGLDQSNLPDLTMSP